MTLWHSNHSRLAPNAFLRRYTSAVVYSIANSTGPSGFFLPWTRCWSSANMFDRGMLQRVRGSRTLFCLLQLSVVLAESGWEAPGVEAFRLEGEPTTAGIPPGPIPHPLFYSPGEEKDCGPGPLAPEGAQTPRRIRVCDEAFIFRLQLNPPDSHVSFQ